MRRSPYLLVLHVGLCLSSRARADEPPLVHPLYVHLPDAAEDDAFRRAFTDAAERYKLRPVEVVDVPSLPPPRAPDLLKIAAINVQKLAFADALRDLDAAVTEVAATGGAGLSTDQLFDLYLYRAMATARADWNATADAPATEARARAYADYLRAATVAPARTVNPKELPPQVIADFARAAEEVRQRPRGTLAVRGSADAQVALDGGPLLPVAGGVTFRDLAYGEHLLYVEEIGFQPWGTAVTFNTPSLDLDIPPRTPLGLDDAVAAAHARRMGARFALVAEPKGGPGSGALLRLVDASGTTRDSATLSSHREAGLIDAAVMRLDEQARRLAQVPESDKAAPPTPALTASELSPAILLTPPATKTRFQDDPIAWARDHWPLLTAAGTLVLSAVVLGVAVASDR